MKLLNFRRLITICACISALASFAYPQISQEATPQEISSKKSHTQDLNQASSNQHGEQALNQSSDNQHNPSKQSPNQSNTNPIAPKSTQTTPPHHSPSIKDEALQSSTPSPSQATSLQQANKPLPQSPSSTTEQAPIPPKPQQSTKQTPPTIKGPCATRTFSLQSKPPLSPRLLLEQLALECRMSLSLEDNAQDALDTTKVLFTFHNATLQEILSTVTKASDTRYIIEPSLIRLSHLQTKTFPINYIATARVGSSNTDVVYGQESQGLNPYTTYQQSQSSLGDDIHTKALALGTQSPLFGKSGTKIYSIDELNFWGDLENELLAIIYQENDTYRPKHPRIIINKGAGLITIHAAQSQLDRAEAYLQALQSRLREQVQIDVQIFHVEHSNSNTIGVNWSKLFELGLNTSTQTPLISASNGNIEYGVYVFAQDLRIGQIVQFLQEYGKTTSVSNPKIITLNNQPAIISVGNVLRYSQSLIYQTSTNSSTIQNTGFQYPSVFSGVLLDVTPSIYGQEIILKINPSITAAKDPSIENQAQALNAPPNLSSSQLSSIVRLHNGERVILGGLISESDNIITKRLPILGQIPLIKYLFSYKTTLKQKREMVIIITPTIITNTFPQIPTPFSKTSAIAHTSHNV